MSLYGSMTTAISGLKAQSQALSNIAGNVANSGTVGFKRVDTSFEDLVSRSGMSDGSGGVIATNVGTTTIRGAIASADNPLALAIAGQGFFNVSRPIGRTPDGTYSFSPMQVFTRAGDFSLDRDGYVINSSGYVLRGWETTAAGVPDRSAVTEIRINRGLSPADPSENISLVASLPKTIPAGVTEFASNVAVYDALGIERQLRLTWSQTTAQASAGRWQLNLTAPELTGAAADLGSVELEFGVSTLNALDNENGTVAIVPPGANGTAAITFAADFGVGAQTMRLNLGAFGSLMGITVSGDPEYRVQSLTQDGAGASPFSFLSFNEGGDVIANYENGNSRTVARIPVVTFAAPDELQRMDGQAFVIRPEAGPPRFQDAGSGDAGRIAVSAREGSNVDIATEFSKLIVAQRAYSANSRIITSADQMLQEAINLGR